jgi:glycosyltransferase involved in cell wall biosynthesis
MRICLVSNGANTHIERLARYLISRGHDVHLIAWNIKASFPSKVHLHELTSSKIPVYREISCLLQTRCLVKRIRPDVLDGQYITAYGFMAACAGFHPLVITALGSDILIDPWQNPFCRFTVRFAIRKADRVTLLFSPDTAVKQISKLGVSNSKLRYSFFGVDTELFYKTKKNLSLAKRLGIHTNKHTVINTRNYGPVYDINTFLRAIPFVLKEVPETQFIIVCWLKYDGSLDMLVRQLEISNNVLFVERVQHADMPLLLSLTDIYVSTSLSDGASNSLFEAMSCQVAPVVTDIPANRPWIIDGENGLLFKPGDYITLAEKIIYLLKNRGIGEVFGTRCREIVRQKAEQRTGMAKFEAIYHEIVDEYSGVTNGHIKRALL